MNVRPENKAFNAEVYGNQDDWASVHSDVAHGAGPGRTPSSLLCDTLENL